MPRAASPNSRTIPVTIKVTRTEADMLRRVGGTTGKGMREVLARWVRSRSKDNSTFFDKEQQ